VYQHPPVIARSTREGTPDARVHSYHTGATDVTGGEGAAGIPPMWVPLADLAWWVSRVHGLEGDAVLRYLVLELRRGPHLRVVWPPPTGPQIVQSWDWATFHLGKVEWDAGHVLLDPLDDSDDPPRRYSIEALWEAVEETVRWSRNPLKRLSAPVSQVAPKASPESEPASPRRGRRPKYNWDGVMVKVLQKLQDDGAPVDGDGGQAEFERFVADLFSPDNCPTESVIRDRVRGIIEAFRRNLYEGR
jgi:hypothetical protein